jgi:hypothetical protein
MVGTACEVAAGRAGCGARVGVGWVVATVGDGCEVLIAGAAAGRGPSGGFGGAAPGLSTIVFSKSCGAAGFVVWSLMYFSLYLPS